MKKKAPVFIAAPRSRSTALFTLAAPWAEQYYGLISLGQNTEFFNEFSWMNYAHDMNTGHDNRMEYFPVNSKRGLSHHYVYPPFLNNKLERNHHKIRVLQHEQKQGRNYNVKIMTDNFFSQRNGGWWIDEELLDFYSNRKMVITRRKDLKGLAFSLLLANTTGLWHRRNRNEADYERVKNGSTYINPNLTSIIRRELESLKRLDRLEDIIQGRGYPFFTFYYEDLKNIEDMSNALDMVYGNDEWRKTINQQYLDAIMTKDMQIDYTTAIENYEEVEKSVNMLIAEIIENG